MDSVEATHNSSNDLLGSILLKIDDTFSNSSKPNMPKVKPQNTTTKHISENYKHSVPLGLETEFPTEYMNMVGKLIREDDPIQNTTFNATSIQINFRDYKYF